jgi:hypothetical protein
MVKGVFLGADKRKPPGTTSGGNRRYHEGQRDGWAELTFTVDYKIKLGLGGLSNFLDLNAIKLVREKMRTQTKNGESRNFFKTS